MQIQSKIYNVSNDEGYLYTSTDKPLYQNISKFYLTYKNLICEWDESLFTPLQLLNDIILKIGNDHHNCGLIIQYSLKNVLNISTINWKFYQKFLKISNNFQNPDIFKFYVIYFKHDLNKLLDLVKINQDSKNLILKTFQKNKNLTAANFNNSSRLDFGCTIAINGNLINHLDRNKLQFTLDHQINHYFDKFQFNEQQIPENLSLNNSIKSMALKAGYSLKTREQIKDFVQHILENSEFLEMCRRCG